MEIKRLLFRMRCMPCATLRFCGSRMMSQVLYHNDDQKRGMRSSFAYLRYKLAVARKLKRLYGKDAAALRQKILSETDALPHVNEGKIWIYWAQGFENAPPLVRLCVQSVKEHLYAGGGVSGCFAVG